jgi:hypothetical protein
VIVEPGIAHLTRELPEALVERAAHDVNLEVGAPLLLQHRERGEQLAVIAAASIEITLYAESAATFGARDSRHLLVEEEHRHHGARTCHRREMVGDVGSQHHQAAARV